MRRATTIVLALMGGGVVLWGATRSPSQACLDARAQHLPNADAICSTSNSSSSHGGSSYFGGSSSSSSGTSTASVSRGGFGSAGAAAAAGS